MLNAERRQSLGTPKSNSEVMGMKRQMIGTMVGTLFLIGSTSAAAWAMDGPPGPGRHMGPPPGAIEACKDKTEGTAVEFTNRRGETVKATCTHVHDALVAVPEGWPGGRHEMPPPKAKSGE